MAAAERLPGWRNLSPHLLQLTNQIDGIAQQLRIGYVSLGPAIPRSPGGYELIPDAIFVSKNVFFSGKMADITRGVNISAVRACAEVIVKCASIEPNGFANLQFAALANVNAGAPFFPAAYHDSDKAMFSIATESADLAVQAFEDARNIEEARGNLIGEIEKHGKRLTEVAKALHCKFGGIDFSLAPFPTDEQSLGNRLAGAGSAQDSL